MPLPNLPFKFSDFVKYPLQAVLFILLCYFVYKEFNKGDDCAELRKIVNVQDKRISKLENDKDELTTALLVKNGIIDRTDSLIRQKVGVEAKQIVK